LIHAQCFLDADVAPAQTAETVLDALNSPTAWPLKNVEGKA
jgi:hypothetical protein